MTAEAGPARLSPVDFATLGLQLDVPARSHRASSICATSLSHRRSAWPRLGARPLPPRSCRRPSNKDRCAVAVEHDMTAGLDHVVFEAGGERERGILPRG